MLVFSLHGSFYSEYSIIWIANTEIGFDPNKSVIKRLWCICLDLFCGNVAHRQYIQRVVTVSYELICVISYLHSGLIKVV